VNDTFGGRVRRLRDVAGLTQAELAEQIGLTRASVANMEGGRQQPNLAALISLATALKVSVGVLACTEPMPVLPPFVKVVTEHIVDCEECGIVSRHGDATVARKERYGHAVAHLAGGAE